MIHGIAAARIIGTVKADAEPELKTAAALGTIWTAAELEWEGRKWNPKR